MKSYLINFFFTKREFDDEHDNKNYLIKKNCKSSTDTNCKNCNLIFLIVTINYYFDSYLIF